MQTIQRPACASAARPRDGHQRNLGLDGLRGLAILMVMAHHFLMTVDSKVSAERAVLKFLSWGWVGVDLFFVLSGFLITGILWEARLRRDPHPLRNFYARRSLRISPLYYGTILLVCSVGILIPALRTPGWNRFFSSQSWCWLYSTNIARDLYGKSYFYYEWFDLSHFWTLAVEEHFYLVWPWVVLLSSRRGFLAIVGTLLGAAVAAQVWEGAGASGWAFALTASLRQSVSILIGSTLAVLLKQPTTRTVVVRVATPLMCVAGAASVALLVCLPERDEWPMRILGPFCLGLTFAGVVTTIVESRSGGPCRRLFESQALRFFGKHSYALYVFHHLFFPVWLMTFAAIHEATGIYRVAVVGMVAVAAATSIGLSLVSWRFLEQPILEYKRYFESGPVSAPKPEPA